MKAKFKLRELDEEDVMKIMKAQQPKLSCGIDAIKNKVVKICCKQLAKPMTMIIKIINSSIIQGVLP